MSAASVKGHWGGIGDWFVGFVGFVGDGEIIF
jgi:hypothetical protein